jgi:MFS transporter, putative metabolite:H+ symporter
VTHSEPGASRRSILLTVLVAALGYFVDIYDLILFLIIRVKSLRGIGVPAEQLLDRGVLLLNMQMIGMLTGGLVWGILGDKRGRVSVLFGSIFLYSVANIANGFVHTVEQYAVLRLVAGLGLAGELGAGITLVSEIMSREGRGWGTTVVAGVGLCGAIVAALVGKAFPWQVAYFVGGGLGLSLLLLRVGLYESGMFEGARNSDVQRGNFFRLFATAERARRYLSVVLVGTPIWFTISILVGLSPELARAMGLRETPDPGTAVMLFYIGASLGDFGSGMLSQLLRSRKKVLALFIGLTALAIVAYFTLGHASLFALYGCCGALGAATGYWAVFVTVASEHFGTNLRATTTTTAPNFVRGSVVPMTAAFQAMKGPLGVITSAMVVGASAVAIAVVALVSLQETFGRDLDFLEE